MSRETVISRDEAPSAIGDLYESVRQKPGLAPLLVEGRGGSPAGIHT